MGLSQAENAMRRILSVTVEEAIETIDETPTAEMMTIRTDPKPLHQCHQSLPSECKPPSHSLSRTVCRSCHLALPFQVKQQHNRRNHLHPDIVPRILGLSLSHLTRACLPKPSGSSSRRTVFHLLPLSLSFA